MAMTNDDVSVTLQDHLPPLLTELPGPAPIELVDVIVKGNPPQRKVQVVLYRPGGLPLDDIATAAQHISRFLDDQLAQGNDLIAGKYTLEVTSPGLTWPLKTARDFNRVLGLQVKITTVEQTQIIGEVMQINDQSVTIRTKLKNATAEHEVPYSAIASAAQALPW